MSEDNNFRIENTCMHALINKNALSLHWMGEY